MAMANPNPCSSILVTVLIMVLIPVILCEWRVNHEDMKSSSSTLVDELKILD